MTDLAKLRRLEVVRVIWTAAEVDPVEGTILLPGNPPPVVVNAVNAAIDAFNPGGSEQAAWEVQREKDVAVLDMTGPLTDRERRAFRAVVGLLVEELNDLRKWVRDFKTQTALATNLTNLQTRVATLPNLADRTVAQAKTAIADRITAAGD